MKNAATKGRNFSRFLLMAQLQAQEIGGRIALARHEAGLTQEQLTEIGTFSKRALQNWESGATIPYRNMQEISQLLGRPVEWFLHGEQPSSSDGRDSPIEIRLAELVVAVRALGQQVEEGSRHVSGRLARLERLLLDTSASAEPRDAGTRVSDTSR